MAGTKITHRSGIADGVTAIAHELDTQASLVTAGAKILSIKNAGIEKGSLDKAGVMALTGVKLTPVANPLLAGEKGVYVGTDNEFYHYDGTNPPVKLTSGGLPTASPLGSVGGYTNRLSYVGGGTTTSSIFVDIGLSNPNQTFTTPVSGSHIITMVISAYYATGSSAVAEFGVNIDGVDYAVDSLFVSVPGEGESSALSAIITLAAGSHTIRPRWRRIGGTGTMSFDGSPVKILIQAQGSGINGLEVVESSLISDFAVTQAYINTPGGNMAQVSTVQMVINTLENERIFVNFDGTMDQQGAGTFEDIIFGYQVDSSTPVVCTYGNHEIATAGQQAPISFSQFTAPLSAGQHTIKLMASKASATGATIKGSSAGAAFVNKFQATRFKSVGIGAGTIVTTDTITANATTASTSYVDTGLDVTIQTIANETVQVAFSGSQFKSSAGVGSSSILGISIDGGAEEGVVTNYFEVAETSVAKDGSFVRNFTIAAAGSHTIKLRMKVDTGTAGVSAIAADREAKLQVTQYRGGLIPVKKSGVSVVDKPTATDFDDHIFDVVVSGTDALVKGNPKYVKTATDLLTSGQKYIGVTNTSVLRTITISSADIAKGSTTRAYEIIVKDESGVAATNTIVIATEGAELIDGVASVTITANYGVARLYSDGSNLFTM